jgi:hypothetical protein
MSKRVAVILIACFCLSLLGASLAAQSGQSKPGEGKQGAPKKSLVARKLEHAHKILDGVAMTDYIVVEKSAEELIKIAKDLSWQKARSERYDELGTEYQKELRGLIKAAQAKSDPAISLAYVRVSLACFRCHDEVRTIRIADKAGQ